MDMLTIAGDLYALVACNTCPGKGGLQKVRDCERGQFSVLPWCLHLERAREQYRGL